MATKPYQVYKCPVCGNIVEVVRPGAGRLVCCGKPMELLEENTTDAAQEKHVPVIERTDKGARVKVGSVEHPMEEAHYIEWIEVVDEGCGWTQRAALKPGEPPQAEFVFPPCCSDHISARAYCNLHGFWKKEG
ncbi:MAG: desulfoferrodoxin [Verrucomicrobia bacterium]|nr:desulfoferrodoxin [Verrucomicrobiota bacterium]